MKATTSLVIAAVVVGCAAVAHADLDLSYIGAFRALAGTPQVYGGGLAFYPLGDGGNGSLFVSDSPVGTGKEIFELNIPSLVISSDVNDLNLAATLQSFDVGTTPNGMVWRSTDGLLYVSSAASGSASVHYRYISTDGTGESTERSGPAWNEGGNGLTQLPDAWASGFAGGKNLMMVGKRYGPRLAAVDPWNDPVSDLPLLVYQSGHEVTDYDYNDAHHAVQWVSVGGESNIIISGKDTSAAAATLWFCRTEDLESPVNLYDPQPYKIESVQSRLFAGQELFGLAYDADNQILYGYEGGWNKVGVVHAWQVADDPPTAVADLAAGAPSDWFMITLSWTAPSDDHPAAGPAAAYDIRYSESPIDPNNWDAATQCTGEPTPSAPGQTESFAVTGLSAATTYYFAVTSADAGGHVSGLSNVATATTDALDVAAPDAVADLSIDDVRPNRVSLSWTASGDDGVVGQAGAYDLRYHTAPIDGVSWADATPVAGVPTPQAPGSGETFTVTGLDPNTAYWFALKVGDEVPNWSGLSNVVSAGTPEADLTAPDAVTDLALAATHIQAAYLTWTAPADTGAAGMGTYDVRYATAPIDPNTWDAAMQAAGEPTPAPPGSSEQFVVTGLDPNTTYYFALTTADLAEPPNVSGLSNVVSGTTLPPIEPVVVSNPWIVNDRVADCRNRSTLGATFYKAYTPDGVIEPTTNQQRVINSYNNFKRRYYHWADQPPNYSDVVSNLNVFGWALCGRHANASCEILQAIEDHGAFGIGTRMIALPGHWIYEANYDGAWHAFCTMTTMYVYEDAGCTTIASCEDIKNNHSLMLSPYCTCPGYLLCGDTPEWYVGAIDSYSPSGAGGASTAHSMDMALRMGEAFTRTWQAWPGQHPPSVTDADSVPGVDPPYHHECQHDWKDSVNWPYWEPYGLVDPAIAGTKATYRRWSNGTYVLEPDFRSAGYQACLDSSSNIATYNDDALTPDLHVAAVDAPAEVVFHLDSPFYLTDAWVDGSFVRADSGDVNRIYVSTNGTSWTQVWENSATGTTLLEGLSLGGQVYATFGYWVKVELQADGAITDAGVSDLTITTVFEHNKGAMAYLDKGINHITVTLDNPEDLASGAAFRVTYKWKEYGGAGWTIEQTDEQYITASPTTYTITTGGTKVPRTESIELAVTPPPAPDTTAPAPIMDLAATNPDATTIDLTWTAPGDDWDSGRATAYDVRYAESVITEESWSSATAVAGVPAPQTAGLTEYLTVTGLNPSTTYYLAIKTRDEGGNISGLSNVVSETTTAPDVTAPAAIVDLAAATSTQSGAVDLSWTAPGDDGMTGTAASYDVRYSESAITEGTWSAATPVAGVPSPQAGGSPEQLTVDGLTLGQTYYFGIKTSDEVPNESALSNVASAMAARLGEVVLQEGLGGYTGCADNYFYANDPDRNRGTSELLRVTGYADYGAEMQRAIVKFDLSSIASGTVITNATLWLYSFNPVQVKGSTGFYGAYRLTGDWNELTSTWNAPWSSPGGDFEGVPDATAPKRSSAEAPCWYSFDVTARVQGWINAGSGNYGWLIKCTDEYLHNQDEFYALDTANAQYRPKLVVTDLSAGPALVSSDPAADGTLCKMQNNVLLLTFDGPIALPDGNAPALSIYGGGWDEGDAFGYSLEPDGVTLRAVEEGPMLTDQTWYRITPGVGFGVQVFGFDLCTLFGDANNSGRVTTADYSEVKAHMGEYTDARCDLNGSGRVTTADYSVVKSNMSHRIPAKP